MYDFPDGPVVKNPPSNAGDTGSIPSQGTKIPHATRHLKPVLHNKRKSKHNHQDLAQRLKKKIVYTIEGSRACEMVSFMPFFIKYILPGSVLGGWERPTNRTQILLPSSLQSGELANGGLLCHGINTKPKCYGIMCGTANPLLEDQVSLCGECDIKKVKHTR